MNTKTLAAFILTAILISGSAYSQSSLTPIKYKGENGLFISFPVMDSISVKLIDRQKLVKENGRVWALYFNSQRQNSEIESKNYILKNSVKDWERLYNNERTQKELLIMSVADQKEMIKKAKIKARKNGLKLLGGGVAIGLTLAAFLL
jgi:hypothetical protein